MAYFVEKLKLVKAEMDYPFNPPKIVDGHRLYVEFGVYCVPAQKIIRQRFYRLAGKTKAEKIQDAKRKCREISVMLKSGYVLHEVPEGMQQAVAKKEGHPQTLLHGIKRACEIKIKEGGKETQKSFNTFRKVFSEWVTKEQLDDIPLMKLESDTVYAFMDYLKGERQVSNRTRNNYLEQANTLFRVMIHRKWLKENPAEGIRKLPTQGRKNVPFTEKQIEILKKYMDRHHPDLWVFTRFIYYGFLRPVEITRLQVKHIQLAQRIILVRTHVGKNRKQMPVVINKGLMPYIEAMELEKLPDNYYLFGVNLKPGPEYLNRKYFSDLHRKVLIRTDLYDGEVTGYSWKHTGVCAAYDAGVDIKSIQEQCRHHSLQETETYMRSLGRRISKGLKNSDW